ncbi:MAG: hypothetical protein U9N73_13660 [Candidatus Auribacterota bacterium]|nr:hypothetical protein [Candidatus Auribacterota bacterium]
MKIDKGIQWIRDVRGDISRELKNDPRRFVEFHKKLRSQYEKLNVPVHPIDRQSSSVHADR